MRLPPATLALLVTAASCGILSPEDPVCVSIPVSGLVIFVQDSATGAWIASDAHFIARSGSYVDSSTHPESRYPRADSLPTLAASQHPGIFRVTVRKVGYRDWTRSGIWVRTNRCGNPRTVTLTARMQRAP